MLEQLGRRSVCMGALCVFGGGGEQAGDLKPHPMGGAIIQSLKLENNKQQYEHIFNKYKNQYVRKKLKELRRVTPREP